jgi:hypothetical protein
VQHASSSERRADGVVGALDHDFVALAYERAGAQLGDARSYAAPAGQDYAGGIGLDRAPDMIFVSGTSDGGQSLNNFFVIAYAGP